MATAPTPGKSNRIGLRITLGGDTRILYMADLGPVDDLKARKECGLPVSQFVTEDAFGLDSVAILWWTARRKSGEPKLKFGHVLKEFPSQTEFAEMVENEEFSIEEISDDDEDDEEVGDPLGLAEG